MRGFAARAIWLAAGAVVFGSALQRARSLEGRALSGSFRTLPSVKAAAPLALDPETRFVSSGATPSVHSATAVEISRGRIRAYWYGGSREGARDVALYSATFEPGSGEWGPEEKVVTREETGRDLGRYVKKLGNPVVGMDGRGRLWLFYVSVSVGGWSGSAINFRISEDEGETWTAARRLVTSPLFNLGTLVRGPMVLFQDGSMGLPVYHELLGKFGELLKLDEEGDVIGKTRFSRGRTSLQPVIVPIGPREAVAFSRKSGSSPSRVLSATTGDAGLSWSELAPTELPNPDSAVSALRSRNGDLWLAYNDSEIDRSNLKIALSEDGGRSFRVVHELAPPEPSEPPPRFAYPWLLEASNGDLHLLYTWNRLRIVHLRFPAAGPRRES